MSQKPRRSFLKKGLGMTALPLMGFAPMSELPKGQDKNLKLSLNAYSFNSPLKDKSLSLDGLFNFCAENAIPAIDLTAYYIETYPEVPNDRLLYDIKKMAHYSGLDISGTGVRNDFTLENAAQRNKEIKHVKDWIIAASKMGAPVLRVFAGKTEAQGVKWKELADGVIEAMQECASFGAQHGVIVAMQNHNDFIKSADQVNYIMENVGEEWFGLVLDVGSYSLKDPYEEISENIHHAVNWQIKENINHFGEQKPVELKRLIKIINRSDYNGYLPIETLGPGDPFEKVKKFLKAVKKAMG
ncbi:sugar phosphate isomerase/epimerase family protein [Cyclobacterium marinum]|uniref:Xylose isomerase domain-containing protein TIM barrel n=1 Tax=Cyclobacterium marinum (strain ATCC 25205 / DSM 745 / LMG 13164 / NCIMB 1802) TaxID=880070 RepID=G0IYM3_CYCMS|nr:sugar phosphate isomerase/epimerase family protein [Cyclobacterium marinum]AEL26446.1 Xylose isomerase domain-containing protein TIM barrel [Cyclobacterium marinum DSM 745]